MTNNSAQKARLAIRALFRIGWRLLTRPRLSVEWARSIYAAEQNFHFERSSPLCPLPQDILQRIQRYEVIVPPGNMLEGGNQSLEGLAFLSALSRALDASTAFEIGTYNGATTWCLSRNKANLVIHTLDLPSGAEPALPLATDDSLNLGWQEQEKVYELLRHDGRVVQHWGDSATFDFRPWREMCDLIYIDGAHSPAYVENDTHIAFELLSPSGAIVWDDYWPMVPGVHSVLNQLTQIKIHRVPGTRLAIHLTEEAFNFLRQEQP